MPLFIVAVQPRRQLNWPALQSSLLKLGANPLMDSLWLLSSALSASELLDVLTESLDSGENLAVIETKRQGDWAVLEGADLGLAWLRTNMQP